LGKPFFVITRTRANFLEVTRTFDVPVLHRVGLDAVEDALSPSLKTVFYVNTAILNDHILRYPHLNHIQLNHGDSDKVASYSPVFRAYDKDFVAGQAAIDRFAAAGLATAPDFFVIVGRPQVAAVEPARGPVGALAAPTALYAPTWCGNTKDSDYTSLRRAPQIVQALLDRGCAVIFRPHPYWDKNHRTAAAREEVLALLAADTAVTGRDHVFGTPAEIEWSVIDCFNRSDFMISDVSSVVNDYLYSDKPLVMMAVTTGPEDFEAEFPVARGAYVVDYSTLADPPALVAPAPAEAATPAGGDPGGASVSLFTTNAPAARAAGQETVPPTPPPHTLTAALDAIWGDDPLAPTRRDLKSYYLGDIPRAEYAGRFIKEAAKYV
ncbi:MAG: CDP-glycerol glycerophosphotransferase family protein, partial [Bifidobacteriaceae bacterium]|nr:CDP-glycerol glycerophosphotransferase family protein [Bifidobacteriaceae bacterium]